MIPVPAVAAGRPQASTQHNHLATAFICSLENECEGEIKIALLRKKTGTDIFSRQWYACTSKVDGNSEDSVKAARHAIKEQTGLGPNEVEFLQNGKPHDVCSDDREIWTVHPFAFALKPGARIIKDSDKYDVQFIRPEKIRDYQTSLDLEISLWRTMIDRDTAHAMDELRANFTLGARSLATNAVEFLLKIVRGSDLDWAQNVTSYYRAFKLIAWHLSNSRPSMCAALERALLQVIVETDQDIVHAKSVNDARRTLVNACQKILGQRAAGRHAISQHFVEHFGVASAIMPEKEVTFLTLSLSGVKGCLREFVKAFPETKIHVIILESRPGFEGVTLALSLSEQIQGIMTDEDNGPSKGKDQRVRITVAADAAVGSMATQVDYVLLGADLIDYTGDISNKIGSLAAVVTVREVSQGNAKVYVTAETDKISRKCGLRSNHSVELHAHDALTNVWTETLGFKDQDWASTKIDLATPLFEVVPAKYISAFVTERGVLSGKDIELQASIAAADWDRSFEGL